MPDQQQRRPRQKTHLKGEKRVENLHQLMKQLITDVEGEKENGELTTDKASAFLDQDELKLLRQDQELFSQIRSEIKKLGINKKDWDNSQIRNKFLKDMTFLTQTSKSKGGVAMKLLKTEKVEQSQQLYEKRGLEDEEKDMISQIMDKVSGEGGTQVVGDTNMGEYQNKQQDMW